MTTANKTAKTGNMAQSGPLPAICQEILQPLHPPGGIVNKRLGRVGDSPIIGACVYAENDKCAVSATGFGEDFMRTAIADTIAGYIDVKGMDAAEAVSAGIEYQVCKVRGRGGVIAVDHAGNCSSKFTTDK